MNELMDARFYEQIRSILETARNQAYSAANSAMVQAYWSIGKSIVEQQGKSERAEYGRQLLRQTGSIVPFRKFRQRLYGLQSTEYAPVLFDVFELLRIA